MSRTRNNPRKQSKRGRKRKTTRKQKGGNKHIPGQVRYTPAPGLKEFWPKDINPVPHFIPKNNLWDPALGGTHYSLSPDFHALNSELAIGGDPIHIQTIPQMYNMLDQIQVTDIPTYKGGGGLRSLIPSQITSSTRSLEYAGNNLYSGYNGTSTLPSDNPSTMYQPYLSGESNMIVTPTDMKQHIMNARNEIAKI